MFSLFGGGGSRARAGWPKDEVVAALRTRYDGLEHLGDDDGFSLYGAQDGKLNFIVALVEAHDAPGDVVEIGFLARFIGFEVTEQAVQFINANLHLSVAGIDQEGAFFLIAGVQTAGEFEPAGFNLILETWTRDLVLSLQALSGALTTSGAFGVMQSDRAKAFAANNAPWVGRTLGMDGVAESADTKMLDGASAAAAAAMMAPGIEHRSEGASFRGEGDGSAAAGANHATRRSMDPKGVDLVAAYFGDRVRKSLCASCGGRGKRGMLARQCDVCNGTGLVTA